MKYRDIVRLLDAHGFKVVRKRGTHRQYRGTVNGRTQLVTADYSQLGEDIKANNLASMIRQSGLPKHLFR